LKNDVIELYNARIDERIRRKKFVLERGLLDFKRTQKQERKKTKEERDIINSMKIFILLLSSLASILLRIMKSSCRIS
jgi:transcriptional adapter 2-alpha